VRSRPIVQHGFPSSSLFADGACDDAWVPDEEPSLPRYQVHLRLSEANAIP